MSATALTVQQVPAFATGTVMTAQATDASNGNSFVNDGRTSLRVNNGSGSPITVTITLPASTRNGNGAFGATQVVTVAAGAERDFGFLDPGTYNDSTGKVTFQVSSSTTVTAKIASILPTPV